MKLRTWKVVGLVVSGGVLLQASSCVTQISQLMMDNIVPLILSQLLSGALGATT